jgi:L-fucose isomerase-like protein
MKADATLNVLPVLFKGLMWGHPEKELGHVRKQIPSAEELLGPLRPELPEATLLEPCEIDSEDDVPKLMARVAEADMVLVVHVELLGVTWTARVLEQVDRPVVLYGKKHYPVAVTVDLYGYLRSMRREVTLAITPEDIRQEVRVLRARKRLACSRALVIGEAFPSWSQVANPPTPDVIRERLGVEVRTRPLEDLIAGFREASESDAERLAAEWQEGAIEVKEEARHDIVGAAKTCLAIQKLVEEENAQLFTIDCRAWDEWTMEELGRFYGPCMTLTLLRFLGIPAACEADVCALLSMGMLSYLSDRPCFLGNIGRVRPDEGWVAVEHAAATVNMDGKETAFRGYRLHDYQNRGCGLASYWDSPVGVDVTFARLSMDLREMGVAAGRTLEAPRCFRVAVDDVRDFVGRCLVGDHHALVFGNHVDALCNLCRSLGITPLVAGRP